MINLENENEISEFLENEKSDWKRRDKILKFLIEGLSEGDAFLYDFVCRNYKGLAVQLNDLRSAIGKISS